MRVLRFVSKRLPFYGKTLSVLYQNARRFATKRKSEEKPCTIDEHQIAEQLAQRDADESNENVGPHEAQKDGDGTAQHGQKGKEAHPGTSACHEALGLVQVLLLHVQVFLYPLQLAHAPHAVVEHRAQDVAYAAIHHQLPGVQARSHEAHHDGLAAKGKKTACQKGGQQHAHVAVAGQKVNDGIHRLKAVSSTTAPAMTKKRMLVMRVWVSARKWAMMGLVLMMASGMST